MNMMMIYLLRNLQAYEYHVPPSVENDAFHTFLLINSEIVLQQELFFQKKCVFQESVY